jgi:hypothetical protein
LSGPIGNPTERPNQRVREAILAAHSHSSARQRSDGVSVADDDRFPEGAGTITLLDSGACGRAAASIEKSPKNKSAAMEGPPLRGHLGSSKKEANVKKLILILLLAVPAFAQEEELVAAAPKISVVLSGLDNPRSLAFGPEGALYVAEAGRGGSGPCFVAFKLDWCYGPSGRVRRLWKGKQQIVLDGLPSWARPATAKKPGNRAQGADGISFQGRGNMYVSIGWERRADQREALAGEGGLMFDRLIRVTPDGQSETVADIADYENAHPTPDLESDPFKVRAEPGRELVIDSGANRLLSVRANGEVSTIATFPSRVDGRPTDSVPTSIVLGPDGAYYVSELTGIPFTNGIARIYRLVEGRRRKYF